MLSYVTICVIFYKLYVKQNEKLYWIINQKKNVMKFYNKAYLISIQLKAVLRSKHKNSWNFT